MKQHIYTFSERRERKHLCVPFRDDMRQKSDCTRTISSDQVNNLKLF